MIEKFDGIRAFWSPVDGQLLSRSGRSLQLPPSLLAESFIPIKFWLDGEIWYEILRMNFSYSDNNVHTGLDMADLMKRARWHTRQR